MSDPNLKERYAKKKVDFNTKKDPHFNRIKDLIDSGKYTASMDEHIDRAHARLKKESKDK